MTEIVGSFTLQIEHRALVPYYWSNGILVTMLVRNTENMTSKGQAESSKASIVTSYNILRSPLLFRQKKYSSH